MGVNRMKTVMNIAVLCLLVSVIPARSQDRTQLEDQTGTDLVLSVVDQIDQSGIFPVDNGFLRRISQVESVDGSTANILDGGIWQVTQSMFAATQSTATYPALVNKIAGIQNFFDINWLTLTYNDLRKPLYSGLAASLFLCTITEAIPQTLADQAIYWKQYYDTALGSGTEQIFTNAINSLPDLPPDPNCPGNQRGISPNRQTPYTELNWTPPPNIIRVQSSFFGASIVRVETGVAALFQNEYTTSTGSTATCSFVISGSDSGGPPLSYCPSNLRLYVPPGTTYHKVSWSPPVAKRGATRLPITTRNRHPDDTSFFPVGSSMVRYNFEETDANNVVTSVSVCAFVVTIVEDISGANICGTRPVVEPRIVSGNDALPGSSPWIGSLQGNDGSHSCGAALVKDRWAVTAAHCFVYPANDPGVPPTQIVFGDTSLSSSTTNRQQSFFSAVINHEDYNPDDPIGENDITLLYLQNTIQFTNYVRPICLATNENEGNTYHSCYAAGWGDLMENGQSPDLLQEAQLPLITTQQCQDAPYNQNPTANIICAGGESESPIRDTCQGDSGGPLACRSGSDDAWHLVGVVSTGDGCARPNSPGFYTRISQYREWIIDTISRYEP